jgi:hypothetical protein
VSIRHTFTLRRPSSGQDTGEIENEEGEYYKTGRPDTHTSTDSLAVLSLNTRMIVFVSVRNVGTSLVACLVRVIGEESVRATGSAIIPPDCRVCSATKISAVLQK